MKKLYTLIIITLVSFNLFAQIPGVVTNISVLPNLLCNGPSAFVIDNTGNKWLGYTNNNAGIRVSPQLMRFNGTAWDTFPHIPGRKVNALAVDAQNNLWIGGDSGLVKYNGTTYTTYNVVNSNIVSDTIISVACGNGKVYVGTKHGLSVFNGTTFTNFNHANNGMKSDSVYCIAVENSNTIWLGNQYGLEKFTGTHFTFYTILNGVNAKVNCIYIDPQNIKWIGTATNGAIRYDNINFTSLFNFIGGWPTLQQLTCGAAAIKTPTNIGSICKGPLGGVYILGGNLSTMEIFNSGKAIFWPGTGGALNQYDYTLNKMFSAGSTSPFHAFVSYIDTTIYKGNNGGCDSYAGSRALLDINNVCAIILDNADAHWDYASGVSGYAVPKQKNTKPLFASAFWLGGYNNNTLHTAAMTYRQNGMDYWPGPLDTLNATIDTATTNAYSYVWKINRYDIANFIYNFNAGNVQNGSFVPAVNILNWPAHGTGNYTRKMAPYIDVNHNGIYDPIHDGDYPDIKGDQMIWHVFNDNFGHHGETGGQPFGVEVHASAYAFTCPGITDSNMVLNNTTFYNYKIFNRSQKKYDSCYVSGWIDSDLGNWQDDYFGCDVMNNFGYTYNGDNYDEDFSQGIGYHDALPAFACNILNGPMATANDGKDNNNNGVIDEPNEKCLQGGLSYYNNTGSAVNGNPPVSNGYAAYYNLMTSKWENGTPITYGNQGLTAGGTACKFMYPGNSDPYGIGLGGSIANPIVPTGYGSTGWTETQATNLPGDRRFLTNIGPFTMQPGGVYEVDWALIFSQDTVNCLDSNTCILPRMVQDNKRVKHWFDNNHFPSCLNLSTVGIKQNTMPQLDVKLYPNPANSNVYIEFTETQKNVTIEVFDILGNLVRGFQYNDANKYSIIPVADLQAGIYILKIKSTEGYSIKKLIKE
ncbi:MAG TPA: T9SS type A sorting domain-containing protein [Bacteroidia bacterium]|jgi:hypothetical protein|nr:T9SS type A sorting domain-containing protein [Bacteroidia bacterium]